MHIDFSHDDSHDGLQELNDDDAINDMRVHICHIILALYVPACDGYPICFENLAKAVNCNFGPQ